mgnify:CR=1 FL=1
MYLYLVQRRQLFKFVNGEVEFEVENDDGHSDVLAKPEEVSDIGRMVEKCYIVFVVSLPWQREWW